jgi:hypothetical protein
MKRTIGLFSIIFFSAALTACGSENGVVGGRCKQGYSPSGNQCVADPSGTSTPAPEASPAEDPTKATGSSEPSRLDPTAETDPVLPISVDPTFPVDPKPVDPIVIVDPLKPPDPIEEEKCDPPLIRCQGQCIAIPMDDAQNCGACGKICRSNICVAGECQGGTPGDVVLVGHDMQDAWSGSAHAKVLVNAVAIPTTDPIRVLTWDQGAAAKAVSTTKALLKQGVSPRKVDITSAASASTLEGTTLAAQYDVILIHDAAGGNPAELGASWAGALATFTKKGGVVIALDAFQSDMPTLVKSAGLLDIGGHAQLPASTKFVVSDPKDVVGTQLISPYAAMGASVGFVNAAPISASISWVVREKKDDDSGLPTVIHRVVY